ncbi:uncharacterized protein A1O5_04569 [Cladophialophora psammophila CBS 110553]|uniref:Nicotinamide N-methyltransferase n=1 Tax=Cladophialophora psammophila CBS 110553 TaxID=1182543 RepID=W9X563_9EURO|nr:uncharacterized protein A1O5_04569 [Cladophialophora psammophila CBS 110553]EXJ72066.1 hypothetical protein A1O5_04569 [Cladophialophora psammophila CBS 110553]
MFPSRITTPLPSDPQSEDIFSSALSSLFTDVVQNNHGVPGGHLIYHSPRFGKIDLRIPQYPHVEEGRRLFAHYLWNAAVIAADGLETASSDEGLGSHSDGHGAQEALEWEKRYWDVRGKRILELGAGTALPSIISARSGALSATITDHPSSPALTTGAIAQNVRTNITERSESGEADTKSSSTSPSKSGPVDIFGYTWGTTTMYMPSRYGKRAEQQPIDFDRIVIADCLWMRSQHVNLVRTILHYLRREDRSQHPASPTESCALVVAGFHTGRETVRHFFEAAEDVTGHLRAAEIFEIDVNGLRRPWGPVRTGENKDQAQRWCVVAVLVRR